VFIIDSREGHLWTWAGNPRVENEGSVGVIYQGRVHPGETIGKVIAQGLLRSRAVHSESEGRK